MARSNQANRRLVASCESRIGRLVAQLADLPDDRAPLYTALATRLRLLVADGRLPVGERLPAERELAQALGVSRVTVSSAYAQLREQGWAVARQGAGTWTALPRAAPSPSFLPGPTPDDVIDLAHAAPTAGPEVARAFAAAGEQLPRYLPGNGYFPSGLPELRAAVAARFASRGVETSSEQILVTSGALHGISVVLEVLGRRGAQAIVEVPTYPPIRDVVSRLGLRPVTVRVGDDEQQAAFVERVQAVLARTSPSLACLTPDHQNPTAQYLGDPEREGLAASLRATRTTTIVDETLVDLTLDGATARPFAAFDPDRVVTVGSLSKAVWGGLRVGWVRADEDLIKRLTRASAGVQLAAPVVEQLAACELLARLDDDLLRTRASLRERRDHLIALLAERLPHWHVPKPSGGLVLWCQLPDARSSRIVSAAEAIGLRLTAGPRFGTGHALDDRLRLPFTQPVSTLDRAIERLQRAVTHIDNGGVVSPVPPEPVI